VPGLLGVGFMWVGLISGCGFVWSDMRLLLRRQHQ
jgi:hypothetical protein